MLYAHMVRCHDYCFGVSFGICAHPPRRPSTSNMECCIARCDMWNFL